MSSAVASSSICCSAQTHHLMSGHCHVAEVPKSSCTFLQQCNGWQGLCCQRGLCALFSFASTPMQFAWVAQEKEHALHFLQSPAHFLGVIEAPSNFHEKPENLIHSEPRSAAV